MLLDFTHPRTANDMLYQVVLSLHSWVRWGVLPKHRRWMVGLLIALLFILVGIPWPVLPYGRPLVRL